MKKLLLAPALLAAGWLGAQTTYDAKWQDVNKFSSAENLGGQQVITDPSNVETKEAVSDVKNPPRTTSVIFISISPYGSVDAGLVIS